jgi:hypothetical protein
VVPPATVRRASIEVVGVVMAVIVFLAAGTNFAVQVPPFNGTDERAHLAYAHAIADGHLPTIDERADVPARATQWRHELIHDSKSNSYRTIWVANHPPLHYMLVAPLVWASNAMDRGDGGLLFLRFANLAFASLGIVFTYLLTTEITGSRRLGLGAAAIAATLARGHYEFAQALNDGLAFAAATAVMWATARVLRRGQSRRELLIVAATVAVAAGARAASMIVALAAVGLLTVVGFRRSPGPVLARARTAAVTAASTTLPAAVLFGWFYARNVALYGDIGGSAYLMDHFSRRPANGLLDVLTNGRMWLDIYQGLPARAVLTFRPTSTATVVVDLAGAVALAGVVIAIVRRRGARSRSVGAVNRTALAGCVLLVLLVAATIVQHVSVGGLPSSRYALPALGVLACLFTIGLDAILPRVLVLVAVATATVWTAHFLPTRVATEIGSGRGPTPEDLPAVLSALLFTVSVAAAVAMLAVLTASSTRRTPESVVSAERPAVRERTVHAPVQVPSLTPAE